MTPKDRTDAIVELNDMAHELEQHANPRSVPARDRDRAAMLRAVAAELAKVTE